MINTSESYIKDLRERGGFARWVAETIRDEWMRQLGSEPLGGFMPNEEISGVLVLQYSETPLIELETFLRDSISCWIWRTSRNKAKRANPFYINTHLLAESSLSALQTYRRTQVRSKAGKYGLRVRSEIKMTEVKYLAWLLQHDDPPINMFRPSPDWIVASRMFGRKFTLGAWEDAFVIHHGESAPVGAHVNRELARFKQDSGINKVFMASARDAFNGARIELATQFGVIRQIQLPEGVKTLTSGGFREEWLEVQVPIVKRDQELITFFRERAKIEPQERVIEDEDLEEMSNDLGSLLQGMAEAQRKDTEYE